MGSPQLAEQDRTLKAELVRQRAKPKKQQQEIAYERNVIRGAGAVVEGAVLERLRCVERAVGSDLPVLGGGRLVGVPFFSLSASRYFSDKETLCLYWPLGTVVIAGPKALDFYAEFCGHRATSLKPDGKDIVSVTMVMNSESPRSESGHFL